MIGDAPKRVYEIGSGSGGMLRHSAEIGHECTATEISLERKERGSESPSPDLTEANSDGALALARIDPPLLEKTDPSV